MQLHNLSGEKKKKKRVGRGGKRGTYSGKGIKGQKSRAGHRIRPAIRDYLKQIPKRRGRHKHAFIGVREKPLVIRIEKLEALFKSGEAVTPKALVKKGVVSVSRARPVQVKILGGGAISKSLTVQGCMVSKSAKAVIEKAGGRVP